MTREISASSVGGKAHFVSWLIAKGERVPPTWVIRPHESLESVAQRVEQTFESSVSYAVRSSANVEDSAVASYAGQFVSRLDVDVRNMAASVAEVRASAGSERVVAYQRHLGTTEHIDVNVMVQPMVAPVVSGVSFSRNPITGLNEVVVEAVAGRGDRLVDEGVTPERWIHRWGNWVERGKAGLVDASVVERIVADTTRLADEFGGPVDLEWVWDGQQVWWVQLRPITGLEDVSLYSNRISREVMPGIIKPLVWSVNVPMVNQAWVDLFTEAIGPNDIRPEDLAKAFAYRSYFNMGTIGAIFELFGMPRDSLELLLGLPPGSEQPSFKPTPATMRRLPRMLRMGVRKSRYKATIPGEVSYLKATYRKFDLVDLGPRSDAALLSDIAALRAIGVRAAYANIVTPLLANMHNALLRNRLAGVGFDTEAVDIGDTAELVELNPNIHLAALQASLATLDEAELQAIRSDGFAAMPDRLRPEFEEFLRGFGHLSASGNDFSVPPWRETPDAVLAMALDHADTTGQTVRLPWREVEARLGLVSRPLLSSLRSRTQEFIAHRELVSSTYTYGYGLFRKYFLEIGRRLVERGLLETPDDVMYLYFEELREAFLGRLVDVPPLDLVVVRRAEIESVRDVAMPELIYGEDFIPVAADETTGALDGIPTSRGHHRGTLRVVRDTSEFAKVQPGDVIAIPYSDVGWTPLFARAGAVVAEAGGMLSHSSIVAREYQIPCVVSVPGATRLPDGATVSVDGYTGTVLVEDEGPA